MKKRGARVDIKQLLSSIVGGLLGVGLIFLAGVYIGKQVGAPITAAGQVDVMSQTTSESHDEVEVAMEYRFFDLLEAPAPSRELPALVASPNPILEARANKKKDSHDDDDEDHEADDPKETSRSVAVDEVSTSKKVAASSEGEDGGEVSTIKEKAAADVEKKTQKTAEDPQGASQELAKVEAKAPKTAALTSDEGTSQAASAKAKKEDAKAKADDASIDASSKDVKKEKEEKEEAKKKDDAKADPSETQKGAKEEKEEEAKKKKASSSASEGSKTYTVQVSAFQDEAAAKTLLDDLEGRGYKVHMKKETISGKGTWYRVRVESFDSKEDANAFKSTFSSSEGLQGFVTEY